MQQLARCGLSCLRDLWRLPRADTARRFGPELLHYLDQLSGQRVQPRKQMKMPDCFKARYDFDQETDNDTHLLYAAKRLLQQAGQFLQTRASLSEAIQLRLIYVHQADAAHHWMALKLHAQQGGDRPEHFLPQLSEQLQKLRLEKPLIAIEIRIVQFSPRTDSTRDLFSKAEPVSGNWSVLLDLLFARLGYRSVYRLKLMDDHRPEQAWEKNSAQAAPAQKQDMICRPARPVWLFKQPLKYPGEHFKLLSDAERLESGWWDEQDQRREYYQAITPSGRYCWLFRDLQSADKQWYVHGLFG